MTIDEEGARVDTCGGSFDAERVVVTVPLGVLKAVTIVFDPPLSQAKQDAIERVAFGTLNKVVWIFGERWWGDTFTASVGAYRMGK